jgi:hypothetical protein
VEVRACRQDARVGGKTRDLGARVLPGKGGPIVPLHPVAKALGLKVRMTAKPSP